MAVILQKADFEFEDAAEFLYALSSAYLNYTAQQGDEDMSVLNDEQHTLTAFCYFDSQVQENGLIGLIASGYGEYIFLNPLADSLRRWKIKPTPKILDKAKALYIRHGEKIEEMAEKGADLDAIRKHFEEFEELDGEYYECADEDLQTAADYVRTHWDKFAELAEYRPKQP